MILTTDRQHAEACAIDDLERRLSWAELDDRARRIARLLRDTIGLAPGDHAATLMANRVEGVELVLGAMLAGVWLTPINHHFTPEEVAYVLRDAQARVLFADAEHATTARAALAGTVADVELLSVGEELDRALADQSDAPLPADGPPGSVMIYTSGTTGTPKGVKRVKAATLGEALSSARTAGAPLGLDGDGPHLVTGPLYHAAPLLFAVYDLLAGASVVIMPHWDARAALELIQGRAVRHTHLVPTMFARLLRLPEETRAAFDPGSLSLVLHGAAPVSHEIKRAMLEWWGAVIVEYWGATESGVCTLADSAEWLAHPGTVGRATASFEVFAVDDAGLRLPSGRTGTLCIRHKTVARPFVYHDDATKTAAAYLCDDAFSIGDIGRVDVDGYVYLSDRKCHTIISGGVNIYPAEVEAVLHSHHAVADVAVFGVPDEEWGEEVKAAVELAPGFAPSSELEAEIIAFAREHLAAYKAPRSVDFEEKLPRHDTGKLHTRLLRDRYWQGKNRSI